MGKREYYLVLAGLCLIPAVFVGGLLAGNAPPQNKPAPIVPCIRIPATINEVHDGDTLSVSFDFSARVRLIDCWAPELKTGEPGKASKANLIKLTSKTQRCMVEIPIHDDIGKSTSLGRVLGRVTVIGQDSDLSTQQVQGGFATRMKE